MKSQVMKKLIESTGISLDASTINRVLMKYGYIEDAEYMSSTGSGEVKTYKVLTEKGLEFGTNVTSVHPDRTSMKFFKDKFPSLVSFVVSKLQEESFQLNQGNKNNA